MLIGNCLSFFDRGSRIILLVLLLSAVTGVEVLSEKSSSKRTLTDGKSKGGRPKRIGVFGNKAVVERRMNQFSSLKNQALDVLISALHHTKNRIKNPLNADGWRPLVVTDDEHAARHPSDVVEWIQAHEPCYQGLRTISSRIRNIDQLQNAIEKVSTATIEKEQSSNTARQLCRYKEKRFSLVEVSAGVTVKGRGAVLKETARGLPAVLKLSLNSTIMLRRNIDRTCHLADWCFRGIREG
ncbi:hypothetical protein B9Z55_000571 [Caenorhabditis nigoni]|uniref:Uncharacterized protein n=1 Tax=Caenorhabditis nigoni TaxID=1611254 RepID=A0A2G5VTU3_9PELO|nr:hypothetical protein B9Z55_000571 [Caenorhabditis nigoni]